MKQEITFKKILKVDFGLYNTKGNLVLLKASKEVKKGEQIK